MKRQLSILLTGLLLAGCQVASPTGVGSVTATARLQVADAAGRRIMATVAPWKITDIHHVKLTLSTGGTTVETVTIPADKLTSTVQFSHLRHATSYVITAQAFKDEAESIEIDASQQSPETCQTFFTTTADPSANIGTIQLKLGDASFNGQAAPTLAITPGTFSDTTAAVSFGMARALSTLSGGNGTAPNAAGYQNSLASSAQFTTPEFMTADNAGNVYVVDFNNHALRKISADGVVTTLVGGNGKDFYGYGFTDGDGPSGAGRLYYPRGVAVDAEGNVYLSEFYYHRIRKVTPQGMVSTYAGNANYGGTNGPATSATFAYPGVLAVDASGNLFVYDNNSATVRRIDAATKMVTTIAGTYEQSGHVDGPGAQAKFYDVSSMAVDAQGRLFLAEASANRIRQVDLNSGDYTVTTIMGPQPGSDAVGGYANGPAGTDARVNYLRGITAGPNGKLYLADQNNHTIRQLDLNDPTYPVTTIAGGTQANANWAGFMNGAGDTAQFYHPSVVAATSSGKLFVADMYNYMVRSIDLNDATFPVSTFAGGTQTSANGYGYSDGTGLTAQFSSPAGLTTDFYGNAFVADSGNHVIRKVSTTGKVSVLAGATTTELGGAGYVDGAAATARFNTPGATVTDKLGNTYVADTGNHAIRKITPAGVVTTIAGGNGTAANGAGYVDGAGASAQFSSPRGLAITSGGTLYVSDAGNNCLRAINLNDASFAVTTLAGAAGGALNGTGYTNGAGTTAQFANPAGLGLDAAGNLYVADAGNHAIRKVTSAGAVSTLAGGTAGTANGAGFENTSDGTGAAAKFSSPSALVVDINGNVFVADTGNNAIRRVAATGATITLAGNGSPMGGYADLTGPAGLLNGPKGIALDASGKLIVSDTLNHCLRKL